MPRSRPTYLSAIISMAMVLFLTGLFALLALNSRRIVALFKEKIDVWLEFKPNTPQEDIARIIQQIRQEPFVKPETITYITREQAAASIRQDLGDDRLLFDLPDLMHDIVRFHVRADFFQRDSLQQWRETLKQDTLIAELYVETTETGNISRNLNLLAGATLGLAALLLFVAIVIIYNTIRLALYANRFIIKNQELVGASWNFILQPYLRRGVLNGIISAVLAIAALIGVISWIPQQIPEWEQIRDINDILIVFFALFLLGVLLSGLSTYVVVRRFLSMKIDELY